VNQQIIGDRTTALSAEDLAALRDILLEQRLFRRDQLQQIAAATAATGGDGPPGRQDAAQIEVTVKLAASARMVLSDVEAALVRMEEGRYGVCHLCRQRVSRDRLTVVPQARYCSRCQQVREAGR